MPTSVYIGIDCGLDGAVAVITNDGVYFGDTPTIKTGKGRDYDAVDMRCRLEAWRNNKVHVAIEKQQAMPASLHGRTQGTVSSFRTGYGYGLWLGIVAGLGLPYTLVHPRTWKAAMMRDMPKEKGASILRAKQLFPQAAEQLKRVKDHGRADALLLAAYLKQTNGHTAPSGGGVH